MAGLLPVELIVAVPPGARHELGQAVDRDVSLHVVLVAVDHQGGMTLKRVPEGLDVRLVVVPSDAVARAMPEGEAAGSPLSKLRSEPPQLGRSALVRAL